MDLASKLFKGDRVIWVIFMFLCLVSVIEVFSATSTIAYKNANHWAPIVRHATFLLGGFVLVLLMHNIPCRFYSLLSLLLPVRPNDSHTLCKQFTICLELIQNVQIRLSKMFSVMYLV